MTVIDHALKALLSTRTTRCYPGLLLCMSNLISLAAGREHRIVQISALGVSLIFAVLSVRYFIVRRRDRLTVASKAA